jgi:uncharacterized protein YlxW (UPF0749 family)
LDESKIKKKYDTGKYIIALCLLILGVIVMLQYKTAKLAGSADQVSYQEEIDSLRLKLDEEIKKGITLAEENAELLSQYDSFITDYITNIDDKDLEAELKLVMKYRMMAGLTDVKGEGITITMQDAVIRGNEDPVLFIIHDMDIISVLNELRAGGAQAIAINGERILSPSEIMCAGPTVRINRNRYPVPYIIDVIGDADKLTGSIESSLIYELLKDYDISIAIEKKDDIIIRKYYGPVDWMIDSLSEVSE